MATARVLPRDREESARTINGKKSNLRRKDFLVLSRSLQISEYATGTTLRSFAAMIPDAVAFPKEGFLGDPVRIRYEGLVLDRAKRLL